MDSPIVKKFLSKDKMAWLFLEGIEHAMVVVNPREIHLHLRYQTLQNDVIKNLEVKKDKEGPYIGLTYLAADGKELSIAIGKINKKQAREAKEWVEYCQELLQLSS